ncbi:hypothetical protein ACI65C_009045 [Semiaphis heraclei]
MSNTRILFWDCQGVTRRRPELIDFIHQQKINILLLNETDFTAQRSINILNYFTYTSNRLQIPGHSAGCGKAILVHKAVYSSTCCHTNYIPRKHHCSHSSQQYHLSSDHSPVVLELHSISAAMNPPEPTHIVNWAAFQSFMNSVNHFFI